MAIKSNTRSYRKGIYTKHLRRIQQYTASIEALYEAVNAELIKLALQTGYTGASSLFRFSDYPEINKKANEVIASFRTDLRSLLTGGIQHEWQLCNEDNNALATDFLRAVGFKGAVEKAFPQYYKSNEAALQAFLRRKTDNLNLSDRIWKLGKVHKQNIEDALSVALKKGTSAAQLSRNIRKELLDPDRLFRRVRDKAGNLKLSLPASRYHPAPGAYRSSYKNAMRLTRTVINNSYREAEQERWRQFDFVKGYEVKRTQFSPFDCPLCDSLAGIYPKSFVFTGWHPQCMCYTIPVLCTDDEFWNSVETGEEIRSDDVTINEGYKKWVADHGEKIIEAEKRGTLPWFLKDNDYKSYL